jgi:PEGA domain
MALALIGTARSALADAKADARTAGVLVAEADAAVQAGDLDTAIQRLSLAYALTSDVETGLRLGQLLAKEGRLAEAQGVLRGVATSKPPPWISKKTRAVKEARVELAVLAKRQPWVRVNVAGPPKGATIQLKVDEREVSPGEWLPIDPGHRIVMASAAKFQPVDKELDLAEGSRRDISLSLSPIAPPVTTGVLSVRAQGGTAELFIDGRDVGKLPWHGKLPPGQYELKAKGEKTASAPKSVKVGLGKQSDVVLALQQETGLLRVTTSYSAASIYLDGGLVGQGHYESQVPEGKHEIRLIEAGYYPAVRSANVEAGKTAEVRVAQLERIAAAPEAEKRPYRGVYVRLAPALLVGLGRGPDQATRQCFSGSTCDGTSAGGLAFQLRAGWNFGVVGIEYTLMGLADRNQVVAHRDPGAALARDEKYTFYRYGGTAGLGLRVTSHGSLVRVTFGAGGGLAIEATQYKMTASFKDSTISAPDYTSSSKVYVAPALSSDLGVLIGRTPGVKLFVGVLLYSELNPFAAPSDAAGSQNLGPDPVTGQPRAQDIPALNLVSHAQFYLGPTLGVQFGR